MAFGLTIPLLMLHLGCPQYPVLGFGVVSSNGITGAGTAESAEIHGPLFWAPLSVIFYTMKTGLTAEQVVAVQCPICRAPSGTKCTMKNGGPRNISAPHVERRVLARELRQRQILDGRV
jgi:hypothetical protein